MNLWAIFFTGLTSGGLSCLAVQGGLLGSIIANQKENEVDEAGKKSLAAQAGGFNQLNRFDQLDWLPVTLFLIAKLISHTLLGFMLGWLGSKVELSLSLRLVFQAAAAFFMLATAGNLLELHPVFRYVVFQPPEFVRKMIKNSTKSRAVFTPAVLGLMTVFIPCGITQAMGVLAVTSGNPIMGALVMFFFVLGTSPLFALVGMATARLSETFKQKFMKLAAALLIFLGLSSINGVLEVLDAPISFNKLKEPIVYFFSNDRFSGLKTTQVDVENGVQKILINVVSNGYSPNRVRVKAGVPVELTLQTEDTYTCATSFILKAFGIKLQLGPNDSQTVTFLPTQAGKYQFTCSMGMYTGVLEVI